MRVVPTGVPGLARTVLDTLMRAVAAPCAQELIAAELEIDARTLADFLIDPNQIPPCLALRIAVVAGDCARVADTDLWFAAGELDLVHGALEQTLIRAVTERATGVLISLSDMALIVEGLVAARELACRAATATSRLTGRSLAFRGSFMDALDEAIDALWTALGEVAEQRVLQVRLSTEHAANLADAIRVAGELDRRSTTASPAA